ncbi:DUF1048 domain-containing protein [Ruminococcaceae bacterium OttesenSCG-928-D13]|nr:DUF1048 domain-containing protein [Ruminococcaceae bacterium OttesenSCG-928-D13]
MPNFIEQMVGAKKEYWAHQERIRALPEDYRFVMGKIQQYIWGFASGDGTDMLRVQDGLIDLFETSAAEGRFVLDLTGEDVAAFCNDLLREAKLWTDDYRERLNRDIMKKLGRKEPPL